ncbi:MAG: tetratricopeptide repeat protein [bacterium]
MSDTVDIPLYGAVEQLPAAQQKLWQELSELTTQRAFQNEQLIPGSNGAPYHAAVWAQSNELFTSHPGFLPNRLLRAGFMRDWLAYPEAEGEVSFVVYVAPCVNRCMILLKQMMALRGGIAEAESIHRAASAQCPELTPFHDASLYLAGDLRYRYPDEAVAAFQQHLTSYPGDLAVVKPLAELLLAMERSSDAERLLSMTTLDGPQAYELKVMYGSLLAERGELAAAVQCFQEVLAEEPGMGIARLNLARAKHEKGDLDGALKLMRTGLEENSGDYEYNLLLGELAAEGGYDVEAGDAFTRALVAGDDEDPEEEEDLIKTLTDLGRWSDNNVRLQYLLADRALNEGEGLRAVKHLTNVKNAGNDSRELYLRMAEAHHAMGLIDDPLNYLSLAKTKKRRTYNTHGFEDPSDARLDLLMISLLLRGGHVTPKEAKEKLTPYADLRKFDEEPQSFFVALAEVRQMMEDLPSARETLVRAIQCDPFAVIPWTELGLVLELQDEWSNAARAYQYVWQHGGPDPEIAEHLAHCYEELGATKWAEFFANEAAALQDEDEEEEEEGEEG